MTHNCGVYRITNTVTGQVYVGSSNNIRHRWNQHKSAVTKGSTMSPKLYSSMRKYGTENFELQPLLICSSSDLHFYEQRWLDRFFLAENLNVSRDARCPSRGVKFTAERIERMRIAKTGILHSEATKRKIGDAHRGTRHVFTKLRENHKSSKINWNIVDSIRAEYATGLCTGIYLAKKYSLGASHISRILRNLTWQSQFRPVL